MEEASKLLPNVNWVKDTYDALNGACVAVILTEWNEFRSLDFKRAKAAMAQSVIVDLRNIYKSDEVAHT